MIGIASVQDLAFVALAEVVVELEQDDLLQNVLDVATTVFAGIGAVGTAGALIYLAKGAKDARRTVQSTKDAADAAVKSANFAQQSASAAQEEAAGAWRPVLVLTKARLVWRNGTDANPNGFHVVDFTVQNEGRGPAMSVRIEVADNEGNVLPYSDSKGLVGWKGYIRPKQEDATVRAFPTVVPKPKYLEFRADYTDLGGRRYSTVARATGVGLSQGVSPNVSADLRVVKLNFPTDTIVLATPIPIAAILADHEDGAITTPIPAAETSPPSPPPEPQSAD